MSAVADAVLAFLWAAGLQLCVPFAAALLLERLLPRSTWPELRLAVWGVVALKLVLPPTLGTSWHAPVAALLPEPTAAAAVAASFASADALALTWAAGATAFLLLAFGARSHALRRAHRARVDLPPDLAAELRTLACAVGLRRVPAVLLTDARLGSFALAGLRQRLVLDRDELAALTPAARRHVLLHELVHVRRGDAYLALAGTLVQAIWWFHPLAWLTLRRLHALRELCCDQATVRVLGGDPAPYRASLLAAARRLLAGAQPLRHAFEPWGSIALQRLAALERPRRAATALRRAVTAALVVVLAVACVPLAPPVFDPRAVALRDLPGCLPRRFLVLAALAQRDAEAASDSDHRP